MAPFEIIYDFLLVCHCKYSSTLYHFDIFELFGVEQCRGLERQLKVIGNNIIRYFYNKCGAIIIIETNVNCNLVYPCSFEGVCVPLRLINCLFPVYPTLNLRRPSFSSRHCTDMEQSSAAYHICSVTCCLLLSLEDILLRTLLLIITVVVPVKWHCHLWTS